MLAQSSALPASTYAGGILTANANGSLPAIDGTAPSLGDRVLLWLEPTPSVNGVYTVAALGSAGSRWSMVRASDCDTAAEMVAGTLVFAYTGNLSAGRLFMATAAWTPTSGDPAFTYWGIRTGLAVLGASVAQDGAAMVADLRSDAVDDVSIILGRLNTAFKARIHYTAGPTITLDDGSGGDLDVEVIGTLALDGDPVAVAGAVAHGIQSGRQAVGANIAAGAARTDTITLPVAYADDSYTIQVTARQGTILNGQCVSIVEGTPGASSFQVNTRNGDTVARQPTIHWMTVHD